jgi:hypothetical protein
VAHVEFQVFLVQLENPAQMALMLLMEILVFKVHKVPLAHSEIRDSLASKEWDYICHFS